MKDQHIELPPAPSAFDDSDSYVGYGKSDLANYARAAIAPYAKRIAELEADRQRRGESVVWPENPPQRKGQSPVLFDDGYDEGWAKCLEACKASVQNAQPAKPVKVPSDRDILDAWQPFRDFPPDWICGFARALLANYGRST